MLYQILIPGGIGIWRCWFLRRGEKRSTRRKTSRSKLNSHYGIDVGISTWATLVGGERSQHCAIPCSVFKRTQTCWPTNFWANNSQHFFFFCDRRSVAQQCWIRLQTSSNINCWGHARRLHMIFKDLWVVSFPRCTAGPNIVGSCYIRVHSTGNTDATTPNIVDLVLLYIVLADNTDRVKEKFCTVMVVFVLVFYSPLHASGPWSIVGT